MGGCLGSAVFCMSTDGLVMISMSGIAMCVGGFAAEIFLRVMVGLMFMIPSLFRDGLEDS